MIIILRARCRLKQASPGPGDSVRHFLRVSSPQREDHQGQRRTQEEVQGHWTLQPTTAQNGLGGLSSAQPVGREREE